MSSKKAPKNKYVTKSHLSERKFREVLRLFCADVTALSAASLTGLNRNTVNRHHGMLRARIAEACEADSPFDGEVEADESCFGARRARARLSHSHFFHLKNASSAAMMTRLSAMTVAYPYSQLSSGMFEKFMPYHPVMVVMGTKMDATTVR